MLGFNFPKHSKHPIRRRLLWIGFHAARAVVLCLPLTLVQWLGTVWGDVAFWIVGAHRRRALRHLDQALGDRTTPRQRRQIARRLFRHLAITFLEWLWLPRLTAGNVHRYIEAPGGLERVQAALAQGHGVVMLSAHLGNWELLAHYFGLIGGLQGGVVARRLRYPEYEQFLIAQRRAHGVETFDRETSFRELLRRLRANQCVGVLPDQDVASLEGVFVEFFGRPAYTPVGPVALALASGAVILPSYIVRVGGKHRIYIDEPLALASTGDRRQDLVENTQRWSRVTESYIRRYPEQWVWMHERWKTQPAPTGVPQ